jgi:hypothetical protein
MWETISEEKNAKYVIGIGLYKSRKLINKQKERIGNNNMSAPALGNVIGDHLYFIYIGVVLI